MSPTLLEVDEATVKTVLRAWGPGKFDAELFLDGKGFRPDGKTAATLLPPAFGLAGVNLHTYTGWGSVTHWNAFVANLEMHGQGHVLRSAPRRPDQVPDRRAARACHVAHDPDLVTAEARPTCTSTSSRSRRRRRRRAASTRPPPRRQDGVQRARRGCAACHVPPLFTEPGWNMHTAAEIGIDDFQAKRSPDERYRTTPLRRPVHARAKGGFYHDGRFATLDDVVNHYDAFLKLDLSTDEKGDLVQYLKSL